MAGPTTPQQNAQQSNPQQAQAELQKQLQDVLKRLETLEQWKVARENQQLTYPLDYVSQQIIAGI